MHLTVNFESNLVHNISLAQESFSFKFCISINSKTDDAIEGVLAFSGKLYSNANNNLRKVSDDIQE